MEPLPTPMEGTERNTTEVGAYSMRIMARIIIA
jgi:hypothetical protein